jgi:hypothetical protein
MSEIEKQAENLYQEIANAKVGSIPIEVVAEWKKLGELLYRQNRPTLRALDLRPCGHKWESTLMNSATGEMSCGECTGASQ